MEYEKLTNVKCNSQRVSIDIFDIYEQTVHFMRTIDMCSLKN